MAELEIRSAAREVTVQWISAIEVMALSVLKDCKEVRKRGVHRFRRVSCFARMRVRSMRSGGVRVG